MTTATATETAALTPLYDFDTHAVCAMDDKALCAYANWQTALSTLKGYSEDSYEYRVHERMAAIYASEFEATIRCIELLVIDDLYEIHHHVVLRFEHEFTF